MLASDIRNHSSELYYQTYITHVHAHVPRPLAKTVLSSPLNLGKTDDADIKALALKLIKPYIPQHQKECSTPITNAPPR
jgi:hypothetical protein